MRSNGTDPEFSLRYHADGLVVHLNYGDYLEEHHFNAAESGAGGPTRGTLIATSIGHAAAPRFPGFAEPFGSLLRLRRFADITQRSCCSQSS
jgi:hypothetical protein